MGPAQARERRKEQGCSPVPMPSPEALRRPGAPMQQGGLGTIVATHFDASFSTRCSAARGAAMSLHRVYASLCCTCSNRRRSLHQGSTDGRAARVHTGLRGCVPRAFTPSLCTHLWHTHATCITEVFCRGDTGVDASLCRPFGAPHGASLLPWLERSFALAWLIEARHARCFLPAPHSLITGV